MHISKRLAEAEDRAVPGHWEGDLVKCSNNNYVATIIERHSRYVMLAKVENSKTKIRDISTNTSSTKVTQ